MEGIVVKSADPKLRFPNRQERPIFKIKNKKFAEVNPPAPETEYEKERNKKLNAVERTYNEIGRYINENRLHNLQSKIGPLGVNSNLNEVGELLAAVQYWKCNTDTN